MTQASDKLYDEVLADARTKAERERRRGRREAEAMTRKIDGQIKAATEKIMAAARAEADLKRVQIMATVEIEVQRRRRAMMEQALQSVHQEAAKRLSELPDDRLAELQQRLAVEAVEQIPDDNLELALPEASHESRGAAMAERLAEEADRRLDRNVIIRPADRPAEITDGLVVRSADGSLEVIQSLSARLRRMWPELRLEVARQLFPEQLETSPARETKEG
ncbi:MAG: hypothetical protein GWP05_08030 [Anaerolineaceae bacterium]|nr:hypothetical protein [Anaerolineaceae bacterium]